MAESTFMRAMEIRNHLLNAGMKVEDVPAFVITLADLKEFENIAQIAGPPPKEGDMVMIAGVQFYVRPEQGPIPFFGIWHNAWEACCHVHQIDWSGREEDRCRDASKESFYHPENRRDYG